MRLLACCYNDPEMQIDPDTVYPIRPDCRDDAPKTRFKPRVFLSHPFFFPVIIINYYQLLSGSNV
jgi:hypothetical protein